MSETLTQENLNKPRQFLVAGASARAAAQSVRRAGFDVSAADLFADTDLREVAECIRIDKYPDDFAEVFAGSELPLVLTGGLENYPDIVATADSISGNGPDVLRRTRDPFQWTALLQSHGFETAAVHRADEPPESTDGWLIKSLSGAGGGHVRSNGEAEGGDYLQQLIEGVPCSTVFVGSQESCLLIGTSYQLIAPSANGSQFHYWGSVGPVPLPNDVVKVLSRLGEVLVSEFRMRGLFGVDFVLTESGPVPIEINPRYTASVEVHELACERSLFELHVAACEDLDTPGWLADTNTLVAKVILYSDGDRVVPNLIEHRQIAPDCWLADIPEPGTSVSNGAPICTMLARGRSINECARSIMTHSHQLGLLTGPQSWQIQSRFDQLVLRQPYRSRR